MSQFHQPFAAVLQNTGTRTRSEILDIVFKNSMKQNSPFLSLGDSIKTGYPVDIYYETESGQTALKFEFALPGAKIDDVEITKTKTGELRVQYHSTSVSPQGREYYSRSISKKDFDLIWKVPTRFDLERLTAKFEAGLLCVSIPRSEDSLPETVKIESI